MIITQRAKAQQQDDSRLNGVRSCIVEKKLRTVIVEPDSRCNLACSFCDLHSGRIDGTGGLKGQMTFDTFKIVIDELAGQPFRLSELQYHGNGEPLLNKELSRFVAYARHRDVSERHRLTTNGTALTRNRLLDLIQSGFDEIHVSLDVANTESYAELKGKDLLHSVLRNIDNAIEFFVEERPRCELFIKCAVPHEAGKYGFTGAEMKSVIDRYKSRAYESSNVHIKKMPIVTLLDGMDEQEVQYNSPCEIPFYSIFVQFDGTVTVCCADIKRSLKIGDITKQDLQSILRSEQLRHIRKCHLAGKLEKLPICLFCGNRTAVDLTPIAAELEEHL